MLTLAGAITKVQDILAADLGEIALNAYQEDTYPGSEEHPAILHTTFSCIPAAVCGHQANWGGDELPNKRIAKRFLTAEVIVSRRASG
ncbi:hypothetical protein BAUCODRAFT_127246 [Baudoinia panamericana UAMH 10762]|uniref:Uncharacterized protein n=1 Tax=Baudoinia panamericana (strain UAMH 10762) TaxID=717646 RepID=M2M431_BAUPA|nr:uncharacterized protein BAUCODRAFT_127246 [Baudoinia panamericana UAMH 10762]EMC91341.1 hypothetical protein BAUCODRAFT_127246 [Baudoinia panamericana UAMH 10762]